MTRPLAVKELDPRKTLDFNARRILKVRIAEFYAFAPIVQQEFATTELHDLRIAAKRLRYTLELFRTVFGNPGERNIERVKTIQEALGTIHDADVRIDMIAEEVLALAGEQISTTIHQLMRASERQHRSLLTQALRPPPDDPRRGLYFLLSRQAVERHDAYLAFVNSWQQFESEGMRGELVELSRDSEAH